MVYSKIIDTTIENILNDMIRIVKRNHIIRRCYTTGKGLKIRNKKDFLIIRKNMFNRMYPVYHDTVKMDGLINNIYGYIGDTMFFLKNCGLVTRLDLDTMGIFLYSLNDKFYNLFRKTEKRKTYMFLALCTKRMIKNNTNIKTGIKIERNKTHIYKGAGYCKTYIEYWDRMDNIYAVTCSIKNGKRHQIRAHTGYTNMKILGDEKYGYSNDMFKESCFFSWFVSFFYKGRLVRFYSMPSAVFIKYYRTVKFCRRIRHEDSDKSYTQ
ncbi:pseudouridine synthase [Candidatus Vidania fulgoroideorum]